MTEYSALYYPSWDPPVAWLRAMLLFYDKINVILPKDVEPQYDEANARVIELIPDAFDPIRESKYTIDYNKFNIQIISKAFDYIAEVDPCAKTDRVKMLISGEGKSIAGYSFLHDSKFTDKILDMLVGRKLCLPEFEENGFYPVNRQASCLILSLLADNYASQKGIRTVTERSLDYTVNALNHDFVPSRGSVQGHLASAVIRLEVPANLSNLTAKEYVEYRKLFGNVREPFHKALNELYDDNLLSSINAPKILEDKIRAITKDFCREIDNIRKSKTYSKIKKVAFISLNSLAAICVLMPDPFTKILGTGVIVSVAAYQTLKPIEYVTNKTYTQRLLANFDKDLIPESLIKKLR